MTWGRRICGYCGYGWKHREHCPLNGWVGPTPRRYVWLRWQCLGRYGRVMVVTLTATSGWYVWLIVRGDWLGAFLPVMLWVAWNALDDGARRWRMSRSLDEIESNVLVLMYAGRVPPVGLDWVANQRAYVGTLHGFDPTDELKAVS